MLAISDVAELTYPDKHDTLYTLQVHFHSIQEVQPETITPAAVTNLA
jgi:hypothetical protein